MNGAPDDPASWPCRCRKAPLTTRRLFPRGRWPENFPKAASASIRPRGGGSREVAGNVRNISDALAEQDAAIRLIAANVEKIARMTESNSDAAVSNNRTASELDGLSRELCELCELREAVSRFRV